MPAGRICALVGPNGAGKTTLLRMLAGLARPTGGTAAVLGGAPRQDPAFLAEIGYLAQEIPLYRRLSGRGPHPAGAHLNPRWDGAAARARLNDLRVPLGQPVGTLSGGQRAQVALTLALAKRPRVLLLDEPVAALDPLARRQFLATLTSAVADAVGDLTVLLSSHVIADLERVCDHMVLVTASRVQLCGDIDELLAEHKLLVGPRKDTSVLERAHTVVQATTDGPAVDAAGPAGRAGSRPRLRGQRRRAWKTSCSATWAREAASGDAAPHHGWRRLMTWLLWRQYRVQAAIAGGLLAAFAAAADRHRGADGVPVALRAQSRARPITPAARWRARCPWATTSSTT